MIVVLSIAGIIMEKMKSGQVLPINPTLIRVMRVLRIARGRPSFSCLQYTTIDETNEAFNNSLLFILVLKLLKMAKGIRALLDTVIQALPQVGNLVNEKIIDEYCASLMLMILELFIFLGSSFLSSILHICCSRC